MNNNTCNLNAHLNYKCGFSLIEILIVSSILAISAAIIIPSAGMFLQKNSLDTLVHNTSMMCREVFQRAVQTGNSYIIRKQDQKLLAYQIKNSQEILSKEILLRPVLIESPLDVKWPEDGWKTIPQGYCETPQIRFVNPESNESLIYQIRAYDASLIRKSIK